MRKRKSHSLRKTAVLFLSFALLSIALGGTLAYFNDKEVVDNEFELGEVRIQVLEPSWEEPERVFPGVTYPKDPQVRNCGTMGVWLRARITFNEAKLLKKAAALNGVKSLSDFFDGNDPEYWMPAGVRDNTDVDDTITYIYYYWTVLEPGEDSRTEPIFTSFTLPEEVRQADMGHLIGHEFTVVVAVDAVQNAGQFSSAKDAFQTTETVE